jgi:hypothetical protein
VIHHNLVICEEGQANKEIKLYKCESGKVAYRVAGSFPHYKPLSGKLKSAKVAYVYGKFTNER